MSLVKLKSTHSIILEKTTKIECAEWSSDIKDTISHLYTQEKGEKVTASICNAIITGIKPVFLLTKKGIDNIIEKDDNISEKFTVGGKSIKYMAEAINSLEMNDIVKKIRPQQGSAAAIFQVKDKEMRDEMVKEIGSKFLEVLEEKTLKSSIDNWDKLSRVSRWKRGEGIKCAEQNNLMLLLEEHPKQQVEEIVIEIPVTEVKSICQDTESEILTLCPICKKTFAPTKENSIYCSNECRDSKLKQIEQTKIKEQKNIDKEANKWLITNREFLKKLGHIGEDIGGQVEKIVFICPYSNPPPDYIPANIKYHVLQDQHRTIFLKTSDLLKMDSKRPELTILECMERYEESGVIKAITIDKEDICVLIDSRKNIQTDPVTLDVKSTFLLANKTRRFITASELRSLINE